MPPLDVVALYREWFDYDPHTGIVSWRKCASNRAPSGSALILVNSCGYIVATLHGRTHRAHRIAFALMVGYIPTIIDHADGNRTNNRWDNLRAATRSQNAANAARHVDNRSGYKGVTRTKDGRFRARIRVNYKLQHVGYYATAALAHAAYVQAAGHAFGEYMNDGADR